MNLLRKLKSSGLMAIAVIFLMSAAISACGDGKKENTEDTEMNSDSTTHMNDMNHEGGEEHPTSEEGTEEHPTN